MTTPPDAENRLAALEARMEIVAADAAAAGQQRIVDLLTRLIDEPPAS